MITATFKKKDNPKAFELLEFVARAKAAKDGERPGLQYIKIEAAESEGESYAVATNANSLFYGKIKTIQIKMIEPGLYKIKRQTKAEIELEKAAEELIFPDWKQTIKAWEKNGMKLLRKEEFSDLSEMVFEISNAGICADLEEIAKTKGRKWQVSYPDEESKAAILLCECTLNNPIKCLIATKRYGREV